MVLTAEAVRVLGCLVEKERTVPDAYPLTLNALVNACNQTSNRWPVLQLEAGAVQRTLDDLKADGFIRFVHPSHGERTTKFRHVVDERLGLDPAELAVLAVLLLRGPQTAGELRGRSERLHAFASTAEVDATLGSLAGRAEPLVRRLERRAGEREARWAHVLSGDVEDEPETPADVHAVRTRSTDSLEARVEVLEREVARLYELLGEERSAPNTV